MIELVENIWDLGDFVGGVVECVVWNVLKGLGFFVFDKLEVDLVKGIMFLLVSKGFEIGFGFVGIILIGSEYNDEFYIDEFGEICIVINCFGGI